MTTSGLFNELEKITTENILSIESNFSNLTDEQLNWKPRSDNWNIREIFAHLYEFAKYYHSAFSKKIDTTRFNEPSEAFTSSPLGKSMWKAMKLGNAKNVKRKMKAHKLYNPTIVTSIVTDTVVADFLNSQKELLHILERAKKINVRKAKIKLAYNNVIKFRIGDAFLYVIYHNQRHIQQAINLRNNTKFPQ
ncbi:MAG: DinB family protein [Crocinitomicaceae bacterium]|nr:DinB family protein [Crocinitomicaceae bacterium]